MAMGTDNGGQVLQGAKILVLEDEFFIALDVEAAMQTAGADVVGPLLIYHRRLRRLAGRTSHLRYWIFASSAPRQSLFVIC